MSIITASRLFHLLVVSVLISLSKANPIGSQVYLYLDAASHPIQEFLVDRKDLNTKPTYILQVTWPRVVQYYSPSSKICQDFKPVFVDVARQLRKLSSRIPISFIAVSCTAHNQLCRDLGINAVPHVVGYEQGSTEGKVMKRSSDNRLDFTYVADMLDIPLDNEAVESKPINMRPNANAVLVSKNEHTDEPSVFADASQSFIYSLQKMQKDFTSPLSSFQKDAFIEWIDLLHWSLPSQWKLHNLINDVRHNYNSIAKKPSQIKLILDSHNAAAAPQWSDSCRIARTAESGYSCGLWKLFHIISIGVSEQHRSVLGGKERISSSHVADVILNYIAIFFDCEICLNNFLQANEKCISEKCVSLSDSVNEVSTNWKELASWVWHLHNDINIRKLHDQASMTGRTASKVEEEAVIWPTVQQCPQCHDLNGEWNRNQVFSFLFNEYWPKGISNPRFVVLDRSKRVKRTRAKKINKIPFIFLWSTIAFILWSLQKKENMLKIKRIVLSKWHDVRQKLSDVKDKAEKSDQNGQQSSHVRSSSNRITRRTRIDPFSM